MSCVHATRPAHCPRVTHHCSSACEECRRFNDSTSRGHRRGGRGGGYVITDLGKVEHIATMPSFPSDFDAGGATHQLLRTVATAVDAILLIYDEDRSSLDPDVWVPGWQRVMLQCCRRAVAHNKPTSIGMNRTRDFFFAQVDRALAAGTIGLAAYALLRRLMAAYFDNTDQGAFFERLRTFGGAVGDGVRNVLSCLP